MRHISRGPKIIPRGRLTSRRMAYRRPRGGRSPPSPRSPIRRSRSPSERRMKHESSHLKKRSRSPRTHSYSSSSSRPSSSHVSRPSPERSQVSKRILSYAKERSSRSPIPKRLPSTSGRHRQFSPPTGHRSLVRCISPPAARGFSPTSKKRMRSPSGEMIRSLDKRHEPTLSARIPHSYSGASTSTSFSRDHESYMHQAAVRPAYSSEHHREGYDMPIRDNSLVSVDPVYSEHRRGPPPEERSRHYNLTLDERFRSVAGPSTYDNQRIRYTREDLENITIDIKRNVRDVSPTIRRIFDPNNVKLVRRPGEGHRPLFDRDEIKMSTHDLREESYLQHGAHPEGRSAPFVFNYKEMENYEITRHRFESHPLSGHSNMKLSDKFKRQGVQKSSKSHLDQDERYQYSGSRRTPDYEDVKGMTRQKSIDQDFHSSDRRSSSRLEYLPSTHKPPTDSQHSLSARPKEEYIRDSREHLREKRRSVDHDDLDRNSKRYHVGSLKYFSPDLERDRSFSGSSHSRRPVGHLDSSYSKPRPREHLKSDDRLPHASAKPNPYKSFRSPEKSLSPKPRSYLSPEVPKRGSSSFRPRSGRGIRGRGGRGRPFRGSLARGRGGFRGRGRFTFPRSPRKGRISPSRWKHDMFAKVAKTSSPE